MQLKKTVIVENHNPVPLLPVREVMKKAGVMWVGPLRHTGCDEAEESNNPIGWLAAGLNEEWIELEDTDLRATGGGYYEASFMFLLESYGIDLDKTMARALQPGEKLVVTYALEGQP